MAVAVRPEHLYLAAAMHRRRASDPAAMHLLSFVQRMFPGYIEGEHIHTLLDALEAVERGEIARLIVTMPPRHSKSLNVSENLPAWYLGRNPDKRVIAASHTAQLAYTFSRRVRNKFNDPRWPFPGITVADDKGAVQAWDIAGHRGGYMAVGVGGSPTGHGADLIIIDDPVRSAADADSETVRDGLWEWYRETLRTRLEPGGAIIVTACMTGDTEVTMADGSVKNLRDIKVGDRVATYENGRITSSRILNWINHGPDLTYEIKTIHGRIIKANERHPFLVDTGDGLVWKRVRNLKAGDHLVGVSTGASRANGMDAISRPSARATATATTTSGDGPVVSALHPSTMSPAATPNSSVATASPSPNMTRCWKRRVAFVQSAVSRLKRWMLTSRLTVRTAGSLSITATTQARSEGFSATSATSPSGTVIPLNFSSALPSTSDFTPDEITAIVPAGVEDVFDIQVERTENFIANGVVSHNTRWHENDLTGRLLREAKHGGEQWTHIHMPAINDAGDPLWPERWPVDALERIRASVGSRAWEAQYQGRPTPAEGGILKKPWLRFWQYRRQGLEPVTLDGLTLPLLELPGYFDQQLQSWDLSFKQTTSGSYVAGLVAGVLGAQTYLLDRYRERTDFPGTVTAFLRMTERWPQATVKLVEDKANGPALMDTLRSHVAGIVSVSPDGTKEARMHAASPYVEGGGLVLPHPANAPWVTEFIDEITAFPLAAHDDQADALSQLLRRVMANTQGGFAMGDVMAAIYGGA